MDVKEKCKEGMFVLLQERSALNSEAPKEDSMTRRQLKGLQVGGPAWSRVR